MRYRLVEFEDEDAGKWDALDDPVSFIHNALNHSELVGGAAVIRRIANERSDEKAMSIKPIKTPKDKWVGPDTELMPLTGKPSMTKAELKQAMKDNPSEWDKESLRKVIRSPKDAEKAVGEVWGKLGESQDLHKKTRPQIKLCKIHGTPLTENGKCLQKNCKYS